ncbi:MAG: hypothetical protein AVDCRST_MAG04-1515, partial [uncultured Acetobacteraceae bacterium]
DGTAAPGFFGPRRAAPFRPRVAGAAGRRGPAAAALPAWHRAHRARLPGCGRAVRRGAARGGARLRRARRERARRRPRPLPGGGGAARPAGRDGGAAPAPCGGAGHELRRHSGHVARRAAAGLLGRGGDERRGAAAGAGGARRGAGGHRARPGLRGPGRGRRLPPPHLAAARHRRCRLAERGREDLSPRRGRAAAPALGHPHRRGAADRGAGHDGTVAAVRGAGAPAAAAVLGPGKRAADRVHGGADAGDAAGHGRAGLAEHRPRAALGGAARGRGARPLPVGAAV